MLISEGIKYKHPDNIDKPYVDWRHKDNRFEGFINWLDWRLKWNDLDHYLTNNAYTKDRDLESKVWYSLIFGMTYQSEMSWVIYSNFPKFNDIEIDKLTYWNSNNIDRMKYAKDTKYNKGRIVEQVQSIQKISKGDVVKYFTEVIDEDEYASFERVFDRVMQFYKFGRMSAWITCQTLFETAGLPIRPATVKATDKSNWSVRSGLMYLYCNDGKIEALDEDVQLSKNDLLDISNWEKELYTITCEKFSDVKFWSNYLLESHLCQYKKLMLGGDYAGHSSGDHVSRYLWLSEKWPELDWTKFTEAIEGHHPIVRGNRESKALRNFCCKTGQLINMHDDFDFLPNMYLEADINPNWLKIENGNALIQGSIDAYCQQNVLY